MKKNLGKRIAALATVSVMATSALPVNVFAYGEEVDVSTSTFKSDTDSSAVYQTWRNDVWEAGAYADSAKIALTPGETEKDLNFAWYSATKGTPAVKVWKVGEEASAKIVRGTATAISAENWQGSTYAAANKVSVKGFFEEKTNYKYQYTDNYDGDATVWSTATAYSTADADNFSVILTGDPQIGASGSSTDYSANDDSATRDTYNWNLTMTQALQTAPDAAFLLSAGDQIDKSGASSENDKKTRESEYAGYLYPSVFRSLPIASTIGNHDMAGVDYSNHFNNPNSGDRLGATDAGSDYYFSYGDVLFISLNSNNRNQEEHRALMTKAVESNKDAKWKVVIFHSDIYGSGEPHADTDAATNRIIFAPLMDEFDIDVCFTGHDHTYSRSYQILDGNVIDYDISDGSVTNPEGTLYVSTGSGSGSKYYNLLNYTPYFIADRTNVCLPAYSVVDFSLGALTIKTYDYTGAKYADDFTIKKTDSEASAEEIIAQAEKKLAETEIKYTEESLAALKNAVKDLKSMQAAYTTAEDKMIADITSNYLTSADKIKGYGSIKNDDDKDVLSDGSKANRLKRGESTLIDKTIYTQISNGAVIANADVPVVDAKALEAAKTKVVESIANLNVVNAEPSQTETIADESKNESKNESATTTSPKTGDGSSVWFYVAGMLVAAGAGLVMCRKKEEDCETK